MSLKKQALSGTFWTTGSAATRAVIQILRLSILTRFLERSDFGLVAIVILVLGFTHIFTDLGVSVSLFSRQNISKKEYSSLYWVSLLLGIFLYGVLVLLTPVIAGFYRLPELNQLIPIMGLDLIITTAGRQFRIFREKSLQFKSLAIIDIVSLLLSLGVAFLLAIEGAGVYSLILSALFASTVATSLLIVSGRKRHSLILHINIKEGRSFYRIGLYQTGSQILDYIASQLDILIIGKMMTTSDLGVYNLVKQLVQRAYGLLNPIITQVSVPILATLQEDLQQLKVKYLQMIHIVAFANFGIYGLMALLAKEILIVLYGTTYQEAFLILQILCIWGGLSAVGSVASTIVIIKGRTDLGFRWTILRILINPIFVITGSFFGFLGIVLGQAAFSIIFFSVYWKVLINRILENISYKEYFNTTIPFLIGSIFIVIILYLFGYFYLEGLNSIWLITIVLSLCFGVSYLFINRKSLIAFWGLVRKR